MQADIVFLHSGHCNWFFRICLKTNNWGFYHIWGWAKNPMYIDGEISKDDYQQLKQKYESDIIRLNYEKSELKNINKDIITQLEFCMAVVLDLPKFYEKATIDGRQQLIGSIFTGNLIFKNKKVRTTKINEAVSLITNINRSYRRQEKEKSADEGTRTPTPKGTRS